MMCFPRLLVVATMLSVGSGCSQEDPARGPVAGTGAGAAGSGSTAGTGSAGTGTAGTGSAGTGTAGTGSAGTGSAGTGSAGTGTAGTGSQDGPVDGEFYPLVDGATYLYRHLGGTANWDEENKFSGTTYQGQPAFSVLSSANPKGEVSEGILVLLGTQVQRVFKTEKMAGALLAEAEYAPGFLRFDRAWVDLAEGASESLSYQRVEKDGSGTVIADGTRTHVFTIEEFRDSVTVPAGTFDNCIRVRRVRERAAGSAPTEDDDKVSWFCPGIGKVKELTPMTGETEELVSCTVAGGACP